MKGIICQARVPDYPSRLYFSTVVIDAGVGSISAQQYEIFD